MNIKANKLANIHKKLTSKNSSSKNIELSRVFISFTINVYYKWQDKVTCFLEYPKYEHFEKDFLRALLKYNLYIDLKGGMDYLDF